MNVETPVDRIDFDELAYSQSIKSHTRNEIRQGLEDGQEIWLFDSGTSGNDDVLLYPAGTSEDEIRGDLEEFFFLQDDEPVPADLWDRDRPNYWSLEGPFNAEAAARRWPREAA